VAISDLNSLLGGQDVWKYLNGPEGATQAQVTQTMQEVMNRQAAQAIQQGIYKHPTNPAPLPPTTVVLESRAREMFLKRVGGLRSELRLAENDFLQCHIYGEVVHLFYCFSGKAGVTQENIDMFPSDQLITQFRLILA
jgi:hypothetical protein